MTTPEEGKWIYSDNEEIFYDSEYFDTKEEAIEAGKEEYKSYGGFFVGQVIIPSIGVCVERILEQVSEDMYDEVGEVAESYLYDVKKQDYAVIEERMNKVLHEWLKEYGYEPNFFKVENIEEVIVDGT